VFDLVAPVAAGSYRLIADGIITSSVDVTFELIWRRPGRADVALATFQHHFDPLGGGNFDAQPFEATAAAPAIDYVAGAGDQLVFRYSGANSVSTMAYIPNGDGPTHNGRFPNITLP
jgi:hypothetical protein